jgi:nickel/cobalt exporter
MLPLNQLLAQGVGHAWLFIPAAILLGALHGLEPGPSKTMMAAFIVAVRGTVRQAVMLGLAATISHTAVVWAIALGGVWLFGGLNAESTEPYFQLASGLLIVAISLWMLWSTRRGQRAADRPSHHHRHDHHGHGDDHAHDHDHGHDGHDHGDSAGDFSPREQTGLALATGDRVDAHELEHAEDIRRRFADNNVTTGQIIIFGLTGGLIPCGGAITVLLLCLQLKRITLGAVLVASFSVGLALTMVLSGVIAALSVRQVAKRWTGFGDIVRKAPYLSAVVVLLVGVYVAANGWITLPR